MRSPGYRALLRQLRDQGVAPAYAERLCSELRDHFEDLQEEALRARKSELAASVEARLRLGDEQTIAREFAGRPELKLWVYRSRALLYCLRALSWIVWLACRALEETLCRRAALGRFGAAAGAAASLTLGFLFALDLVLSPRAVPGGGGPAIVIAAANLAAPPSATARQSAVTVHSAPSDALAPDSAPKAAAETRAFALPDAALGGTATPAAPQAFARRGSARPRSAESALLEKPPRPANSAAQPDRDYVADSQVGRIQLTVEAPGPLAPPESELELTAYRSPDGEYMPVVRIAPVFPASAVSRGLEGYVVLEYTITPNGNVRDVIVVESSDDVFEESAIHAISRFKYKPRVVQGQPVHVRGVRTVVRFELEV